MDFLSIILIVAGLIIFETICSLDNAIINAEVLSTMGQRFRKIFIRWGIISSVFVVRLLLPWLIVWWTIPSLGFTGAFFATFSENPEIAHAIEQSAPILLAGGGVFLMFLFFDWLFLEPKNFGLKGEEAIHRQSAWFYAVVAVLLAVIVWHATSINPYLAFSAVVGSTGFFIVHGFRAHAAVKEKELMNSNISDISKLLYLEIIDGTFSIDGVLGAFAFTFSVPLILIGNGIGAIIVRQITVSNIDRIKRYKYLKNGAMYSILFLGIFMVLESFGAAIPSWASPIVTFSVVGYFFYKSFKELKNDKAEALPDALKLKESLT